MAGGPQVLKQLQGAPGATPAPAPGTNMPSAPMGGMPPGPMPSSPMGGMPPSSAPMGGAPSKPPMGGGSAMPSVPMTNMPSIPMGGGSAMPSAPMGRPMSPPSAMNRMSMDSLPMDSPPMNSQSRRPRQMGGSSSQMGGTDGLYQNMGNQFDKPAFAGNEYANDRNKRRPGLMNRF